MNLDDLVKVGIERLVEVCKPRELSGVELVDAMDKKRGELLDDYDEGMPINYESDSGILVMSSGAYSAFVYDLANPKARERFFQFSDPKDEGLDEIKNVWCYNASDNRTYVGCIVGVSR